MTFSVLINHKHTRYENKKHHINLSNSLSTESYGQIMTTNPYLTTNNNLRALFDTTNLYNTGVEYFYDIVAHISDSIFYQDTNSVPNTFENWLVLYEENYYMAKDTGAERPVVDVLDSIFHYGGQVKEEVNNRKLKIQHLVVLKLISLMYTQIPLQIH